MVAFDALSGLDAWVAVPTLAAKADTTLYVYYGGPDVTRVAPWSPLFAGVWHMSLRSNLTLADSSRDRGR